MCYDCVSAHGQPSFHISIWFIELTGIAEESFVEGIHSTHQQVSLCEPGREIPLSESHVYSIGQHQEITVFRHILKHLRQRRLLTAYHNILTQANLSQCFEHPLITSLHNSFVLNGSFSEAESVLSSVASKGLFASSIFSSPPYSLWNRIENRLDMDGDPLPAPSARGGHAMCYDRRQGRIYLFGGWDGRKDLNDFWVFDIAEGFWKLIPPRTNPGGDVTPSPRACHKMVFDETTGDIFLLGRFDESASGEPPNEASPHPTVMSINIDPNSPQSASPTAAYNSPSNANRQPAVVGANHSRAPVAASTSRRLLSEFYRYHTRGPDSGKWELISPDTAVGTIQSFSF